MDKCKIRLFRGYSSICLMKLKTPIKLKIFSKTKAQFRPSAFAKPNLLELASTLSRQRQDSNSDEPESFKIRDLFS